MSLAVEKYEYKPDNLIASRKMPIMTASKEAAEALKRGAPVTIGSDGKIKKITAAGEGQADVSALYGIVAEDAVSGKKAAVYLTGEFHADELVFETHVVVKDVEVPFRKLGIFLV
ncbi:MAG: hypothetical protein Q4B86_07190 [Eubacteriales bacterium]|nr:hypothetical protein [Eubacteriales bacterium]